MRKLGFGNAVWAAAACLLITACGGGGGSLSDQGGGSSSGGTSSGGTPIIVSAVTLLGSSAQLPSDANTPAEGVQLSATVVDTNNNVIPGIPVQFAVDNQGVIAVTQGTTDASGIALATLTTPSNRTNRDLTVRATAGTVTSQLIISVVGTSLSDAAGPDSVAVGQTARYTVALTDNGGSGIGGATVQVSSAAGNTLSASTLTTRSADGSATVDVTVTSAANDTLTFSVAGLTRTKDIAVSNDSFRILRPDASAPTGVRVFGATEEFALNTSIPVVVEWLRGGSATDTAGRTVRLSGTRGAIGPSSSAVLAADGRATFNISSADAGGLLLEASSSSLSRPVASVGAEFVAKDADSINVQFDPKVIGPNSQSTVVVTVQDTAGNLVKNARINFTLTDPTNGTLSASSAVTNSQGRASIIYTASSTQSANEGVVVRATVAASAGAGVSNFDTDTLTVNGRALRIVLGTGNQILVKNETLYQMPYGVVVTDSAGNAVTDADLRLEAISTRYRKGFQALADSDGDGIGDKAPWRPVVNATCNSEDLDNDGDFNPAPGPDVDENTNGTLEPGNVATVPPSVALDAEGSAQFLITYPKDRANWVEIKLKASALVSGTENVAVAKFILPILAEDINDANILPPGAVSPYGEASTCSDPN